MLGGFILELRHAGGLAKHGEAVEDPGQFGVRGNMTLYKQDAFFRIQPARDVLGQHLQRGAAQLRRFLADGDRVHIDHAVDAVVVLLKNREIPDRTQIIAKRQFTGRLYAGKNRFFLVVTHLSILPLICLWNGMDLKCRYL